MAYSMFSRPKLHKGKNVKYYPEHDYPLDQNYHRRNLDHHQDEVSVNSPSTPRNRRMQKSVSVIAQTSNQKKTPIYIHHIDKSDKGQVNETKINPYEKVNKYLADIYETQKEQNIVSNNRYKVFDGFKKIDRNKKAVISKIEESYWANWKPSKPQTVNHSSNISAPVSNVKHKTHTKKLKSKSKKQAADYDGHLQTMVGHLQTMVGQNSVEKTKIIKPYSPENYHETGSSQSLSKTSDKEDTKSVDTQQIQTEYSVRDAQTLFRIDEEISIENVSKQLENDGTENELLTDNIKSTVGSDFFSDNVKTHEEETGHQDEQEYPNEEEKITKIIEPNEENQLERLPVRDIQEETPRSTNDETNEVNDEGEVNSLKHTDSMILTKKRQTEDNNKVHYEQPKCIRLYKKTCMISTSSFIRGGSYPLKSCLKKENSAYGKGNIRLGRPGSHLIVTSNYFKSRK